MQDERNVKWILVISLIMIAVTISLTNMIYPPYLPQRQQPDTLNVLIFYLNRIDILFFIATMTIAALATTGFGNKALFSRVAIYLFLVSMGLFFVSILKLVLTPPWAT